ncbi:MAG: hypothetical protein AAFN93_02260 [Bacteroidota bacterium]
MKIFSNNLYKIAGLLLMIFIGFGCDEDDIIGDNPLVSQRNVYFSNTNVATANEAAVANQTADGEQVLTNNQIEIFLERSGQDASQPLTVNFGISAVFASTTDFQNEGDDASSTLVLDEDNAVTFAAGEYSTSFIISIIDDILSAGDREITVTLNGVSDASYSIGFPNPDEVRTTVNVTVQDDDCPIDIPGDWVGEYTLSEEFTAGVNEGLSFGAENTTVLTADPSSAAGIGAILNDMDGTPDTWWLADTPITFNTCPLTISLASNTILLNTTVNGEQANFSVLNTVYDESNFTITLVGNLGNVTGSNFGEFTITLKKN